MYGPKWPFLLRYGSHDTRRVDFPRVDGLSTDTPGFGASQLASAAYVPAQPSELRVWKTPATIHLESRWCHPCPITPPRSVVLLLRVSFLHLPCRSRLHPSL